MLGVGGDLVFFFVFLVWCCGLFRFCCGGFLVSFGWRLVFGMFFKCLLLLFCIVLGRDLKDCGGSMFFGG